MMDDADDHYRRAIGRLLAGGLVDKERDAGLPCRDGSHIASPRSTAFFYRELRGDL
jgi:hypothetical protein